MNKIHQTAPQGGVMPLAARVASLQLSEIVRISEEAKRLMAAGHDVISFGTGEPDFPTPPHAIDAAIAAMRAGQTLYTVTAGTLALRQAICASMRPAGVFTPDQVIVSAGAKQVLSNAFMATLDPDDEVIIPAPYWTSYADMIAVAGGRVVEVACGANAGFKMAPPQLHAAVTPRTRWLLLNSPGNPSGAMYNADELAGLAEVLRRHPHVRIVTDEIYDRIVYRPFTPFVAAAPDLAGRILTVNGVSKAYAMTGWRVGWGVGPADLIAAMVAIQGQSTSGASSISQAASLAALTGPQEMLVERAALFRQRRDLVVGLLNTAPGLACPVPDGAFYVFPSCHGLLGKVSPTGDTLRDDADVCAYLLRTAGVAVVPGRAFAKPGHFRLSYAYAAAALREGCNRIVKAMEALQ